MMIQITAFCITKPFIVTGGPGRHACLKTPSIS